MIDTYYDRDVLYTCKNKFMIDKHGQVTDVERVVFISI